MDRRLQRQFNALASEQFNIQPSTKKNFQAIIVLATGTNQSGQTGTPSDVGRIRTTRNQSPVHNVDYNTLADVGDINFGSNILSSTTGGAFTASFYVPNHSPSFESALQILGDTEFNVEHVPGDDGTVFASLSIKAYAVYSDFPELYTYRMLTMNQSEDGAISEKGYNIPRNNVESIFLKDVDDVITLVSLVQDGETVLSPQPYELLEVATLYENRLEASSVNRVKIETHSPGVAQSTINRGTEIALTTSATGDFEILYCSMDWNV